MKKRLNQFATAHGVPMLAAIAEKNGALSIIVEKDRVTIEAFHLNRADVEKFTRAISSPGTSCVVWPEFEILRSGGAKAASRRDRKSSQS